MKKALVLGTLVQAVTLLTLLPAITFARPARLDTGLAVEPRVATQALPLKWKTHAGSIGNGYPEPLVAGGVVYHTYSSDSLIAVNADTGQTMWRFSPALEGYGGRGITSPIFSGNLVLFGISNLITIGRYPDRDNVVGYMFAVDATTGEEKWRFKVVEEQVTTPTVAGGVVYFATSYPMHRGPGDVFFGQVYALELATGKMKWQMPFTDSYITQDPVASTNTLYVLMERSAFQGQQSYLYAIDIRTQTIKWEYSADKGQDPLSGPVLVENSVYFVGYNKLYALDARTGAPRWTFTAQVRPDQPVEGSYCCNYETAASPESSLSYFPGLSAAAVFTSFYEPLTGISTLPAISKGTAYLGINVDTRAPGSISPGLLDGWRYELVAVDTKTGQERWTYDTQEELPGGLLVAHNTIYFHALSSNNLRAVDTSGSQPRWLYEAEGVIVGRAASDEDAVYFADDAGYLYALATGLPGMPTTGEPPPGQLACMLVMLALLSLTFGLALTKMSKAHARTEDY